MKFEMGNGAWLTLTTENIFQMKTHSFRDESSNKECYHFENCLCILCHFSVPCGARFLGVQNVIPCLLCYKVL